MTASIPSIVPSPHVPLGQRGPRADVLRQIKEHPRTARELAERLGLSLNAVRHHLKELEAEGLVRYDRAHRGVGAPAFLYSLSLGGEALFPRRFEEALSVLLEQLIEREGHAAATGLLQHHLGAVTRRIATAFVPGPTGAPDEAIEVVAQRFPDLCAAEARFLAEVLSAELARREHLLSGCVKCEHHERFRSAEELV